MKKHYRTYSIINCSDCVKELRVRNDYIKQHKELTFKIKNNGTLQKHINRELSENHG